MKYRHIVSITGMSGLYQLLNTKSNGAFVKSLEDLSNKFIASRSHQVTPLESIEIYTNDENIYLHEVLEKLKSVDDKIEKLDFKDTKTFVATFAEAVPEYDTERVYNSDIKKILKWYLLLKKNDLLDFSEYQPQPEEEQSLEAEAEVATEKAAPTKAKKTSTKKEEAEDSNDDKAEKPAKKTRTKKAAAASDDTEKPAKKTSTKKAATKKSEDK